MPRLEGTCHGSPDQDHPCSEAQWGQHHTGSYCCCLAAGTGTALRVKRQHREHSRCWSWEENIRTSPKSSCVKHQTQDVRRLWLLPELVWLRNVSECWWKCNISHALHNKYAKNENCSVCGLERAWNLHSSICSISVSKVWNIAVVSGL